MSLRETVIPDVNILLYGVNQDADQHIPARDWLNRSLSGAGTVGFTWPVLNGFLRLVTLPWILERPLDLEAAFRQIKRWLAAENAILVEPASHHVDILEDLLLKAGTAVNLVSDAHLAAIAIEYGAKLASFDSDFHRFAELRFEYLGAR